PGGAGLGLVIVRDVLRAHGGDVNLIETGETGTVFRVKLPERCSGAIAVASRSAGEADTIN
ncbi:MAG: ATP-binding protein, partial [Proteobacteria bacterium]|nr:ATP-binding protein [Pseudomonadota bacterium]